MKYLIIISLICGLVTTSNAGWISTIAAISASESADKAQKSTEQLSAKIDQLIELMKQDHERIEQLEKKLKAKSSAGTSEPKDGN